MIKIIEWIKTRLNIKSVVCYYVLRYGLLDLETIKQYVLKYYIEGITPIHGRGKEENNIIAYMWRFYDSEYEKNKNS